MRRHDFGIAISRRVSSRGPAHDQCEPGNRRKRFGKCEVELLEYSAEYRGNSGRDSRANPKESAHSDRNASRPQQRRDDIPSGFVSFPHCTSLCGPCRAPSLEPTRHGSQTPCNSTERHPLPGPLPPAGETEKLRVGFVRPPRGSAKIGRPLRKAHSPALLERA